MKKILLTFALLASMAYSQAAVVSVVPAGTAGTNTVVLTNAMELLSVAFIAPSNTVVRFYDSYSTNCVTTNAAYITHITYVTNLVSTYIGSTGLTNVLTNSVLFTAATTNAAATNAMTPIAMYALPAGFATTFADINLLSVNGLTMSNDAGGLTAVITYKLRH